MLVSALGLRIQLVYKILPDPEPYKIMKHDPGSGLGFRKYLIIKNLSENFYLSYCMYIYSTPAVRVQYIVQYSIHIVHCIRSIQQHICCRPCLRTVEKSIFFNFMFKDGLLLIIALLYKTQQSNKKEKSNSRE